MQDGESNFYLTALLLLLMTLVCTHLGKCHYQISCLLLISLLLKYVETTMIKTNYVYLFFSSLNNT